MVELVKTKMIKLSNVLVLKTDRFMDANVTS